MTFTHSREPITGNGSLRAEFNRMNIVRRPEFWAALVYAVLVLVAASRHEPWADEAQAWLLARDASLVDLWSRLLRLEGSPGLWHSILHFLIRAGMPYDGLNYVSAMLGLAATVVILGYAPFPLAFRILLPFTYFLCFQYSIVARSYSLAPVILFSLAAVYRADDKRIAWITFLLVLLATVSAQGFLLSTAIALTFGLEYVLRWRSVESAVQRKLAWSTGFYVFALALITWAVWPAHSATFVAAPNWSLPNFIGISRYSFQQAFGNGYWPLALITLSVPMLWRGPGLLLFVLAALLHCCFGSVIYSNVWHHGFLVLVWLFALWISPQANRPGILAGVALSLFLVMQCSWTWNAVRYDWAHAYSGSRVMAEYLKNKQIVGSKIFGIGFPTVAVQPYFRSNLYGNYAAAGGEASYWLWSKHAGVNDSVERLGSDRPDFLVLGYSSDSDRRLWTSLIARSGYESVARFEGSTFWRTDVFQPENFELFRPGKTAGSRIMDCTLSSELDLAKAEAAVQLLWGFLDVPGSEGRWVGNGFSVALQRPSLFGARHGSDVQMDFQVSDEQIRASGPLVLRAYVSGRRLPAMLITKGGHYRYFQHVAPGDLFWAMTPVTFQFAKKAFTMDNVAGPRVALVSHIGLVTQ